MVPDKNIVWTPAGPIDSSHQLLYWTSYYLIRPWAKYILIENFIHLFLIQLVNQDRPKMTNKLGLESNQSNLK